MFKVDIELTEHCARLICSGRLVHGQETELLKSIVETRKEPVVAIDMANVHDADAAGLGILAFLQHRLQLRNRELVLVSPSAHLRGLLRITGLDTVLAIRPRDTFLSREAAVASDAVSPYKRAF
jgi:anti-sigma B factor antagonist